MDVKNKAVPERAIAAVLFTLMALYQLVSMIIIGHVTVMSLLFLAGYAVFAFALFSRDRGMLSMIGLGLILLALVITFFYAFKGHGYSTYRYTRSSREDPFRFNPLTMIPALVRIWAWVELALLAASQFIGFGDAMARRRRWYMPALALALSVVASVLIGLIAPTWVGASTALLNALTYSAPLIPAFILVSLWIVGEEPEGYYPVEKHIALTLFTLTLWYPCWVWHNTRYLNSVHNEVTRKPTPSLLLCLFLPFYASYWNYGSAQRVDRMAKQAGVESKLDVLSLVLGLVLPFLPSILIQDKIDRIVLVQNGTLEPDTAPVYVPAEEPAAPTYAPAEAPAAPVYTPAAPVYAPAETPAAPVYAPTEEPAAPIYVPEEAPAAPAEAPIYRQPYTPAVDESLPDL